MKHFVELPVMKPEKYVQVLRKMFGQIQKKYSELKFVINPNKKYGLLLVHLLPEKLPAEICVTISKKFENKIYDWTKLLKNLKIEIEAKECSISLSKKQILKQNYG